MKHKVRFLTTDDNEIFSFEVEGCAALPDSQSEALIEGKTYWLGTISNTFECTNGVPTTTSTIYSWLLED